jgi:hypothetical protein
MSFEIVIHSLSYHPHENQFLMEFHYLRSVQSDRIFLALLPVSSDRIQDEHTLNDIKHMIKKQKQEHILLQLTHIHSTPLVLQDRSVVHGVQGQLFFYLKSGWTSLSSFIQKQKK